MLHVTAYHYCIVIASVCICPSIVHYWSLYFYVTCNVYPIYCPEYPKLISRCKKVFCMLCELWMHLVQDTRHATLSSFIIRHILFYSLDVYSFFKVRDDEISRVNGQGSFLETGWTIMKRFSQTYKAYVSCCSLYKRIYMCHFL
jgi:hypothetical protein